MFIVNHYTYNILINEYKQYVNIFAIDFFSVKLDFGVQKQLQRLFSLFVASNFIHNMH